MSMAHLLFVRDFEAEIDAERLLSEQQEAVHTASELTEAADVARAEGHAAGWADGHAAGLQEALDSIEAQRLDAIGHLAQAVTDLLADRAAHQHRLEAEMSAFAGDLAERIFPELVDHLGANRLDQELGRIMRRAIGSPSLEIRLSPAVAGTLAPDLIAMGTQAGQSLRVLPDPAMDRAEVQAVWRHGRSRYSFPAICRSILSLIRQTAPLPPHSDPSGQTHD